ncbi:HemK2/MTQ2 family protein methyltransferase [Streptomyces globisporus]|uniref:HemK2/MTQ2 family protein methyltransferase n=1 Tax=Streptomyces globisporus TaxID=1908 RepID=UPI003629AFA3
MLALPGVYAPQHDTHLLMRAVGRELADPCKRVLELGTGSGALAVHAARLGARVTAVDISRRAVLCAGLNAALHRRRITVRYRDLSTLDRGGYDLVISNPPYVPAPAALPPVRGKARTWDGGLDGRAVVDQVCMTAATVLGSGGTLLMVHSAMCRVDITIDALHSLGFDTQVIDRELVPLGPVMRSRLLRLRDRGLMDDEQQDKEELVVFRARRRRLSSGFRRLAKAMRRTGAGPAAARSYEEHVEADAVREQVVRHEVVEPLLATEPGPEIDVAFGIHATGLLEDRLCEFLPAGRRTDRAALRIPLATAAQPQGRP